MVAEVVVAEVVVAEVVVAVPYALAAPAASFAAADAFASVVAVLETAPLPPPVVSVPAANDFQSR